MSRDSLAERVRYCKCANNMPTVKAFTYLLKMYYQVFPVLEVFPSVCLLLSPWLLLSQMPENITQPGQFLFVRYHLLLSPWLLLSQMPENITQPGQFLFVRYHFCPCSYTSHITSALFYESRFQNQRCS